ncbi:gfo/Idh/MocA family oxidoreductase [Opitutaceae bacterium TAV4]|nr:gfo/Idh/MocA family oxidoreductase [Opitutaceae bacterium TAV4]RRK00513.1 gfo/Idh/MocA family oxidoreductase [Opitutaceae bacterium TAV3]
MTLPLPPAPRLKVLHVGVTNRGFWPIEHATPSTGFVSHALCDINQTALEEARRRTGLPASSCFTDLGDALARSGAECVIICTPTKFHVPMVRQSIDAGLPVLVEKGMAPDWDSARQCAAFVQARRAIAAVAQNYRYKPVELTIRRALRDPSFEAWLGPVHQVSFSQQRVRPRVGTLDYPYASIWDMSCHHMDTLLDWFGPIANVTAHAWRAAWSPYTRDDPNTSAHLVFDNGTRVHYLHTHDAARSTYDIELHGERGALFLRDSSLSFNTRPTEQFGSRPLSVITPVVSAELDDLLRDFHAWITTGVEPGISVRHNLETMAACELLVRSISQKRTVARSELDADMQKTLVTAQ